ncbi:hypothetical protein BGZ70_003562 [Mortierella alpina]|uniref:C2H2-type domain-containing protein n=1 Tax=Mortierella alpina TaxID=64518 RepID=A0A9P6IS87_MORAP|nr:hypothetical protein BGZ70_003562 [Mortierella alpina]
MYCCSACGKTYQTNSGLWKHTKGRAECLAVLAAEEEEEETDVPITPITVSALPPTTVCSKLKRPTAPTDTDHEAVLSACHRSFATEEDKIRTIVMADWLGVIPFSLQDVLGNSQYALAYPSVVASMSQGQNQYSVQQPELKKRRVKLEHDQDQDNAIETQGGLQDIFRVSPYAAVLRSRTFSEVDPAAGDILNEDWDLRPQYRYACAQMLAGSILLDTRSGHTIMINAIEVYGRTPMVDAHRERLGTIQDVATATSLPHPLWTRYKDIYPTSLPTDHGYRLVIGTQSFDGLVTSSVRLDRVEPPSVGGSTSSLILDTPAASKAIRIFLDWECVEKAVEMTLNEHTKETSNSNRMYHLRQVKTKFDHASTYLMCRAAGPITASHASQPFSIFTIANNDKSQSETERAAGTIFSTVARNVLKHGKRGSLKKETVQDCIDSCKKDTAVRTTLCSLLNAFADGQDSAPILGNRELCARLVPLAQLLSSNLVNANNKVQKFVKQNFERL